MPIGMLPNISEVEPIREDDLACFAEIRAVLEKHGVSNRYGVCLLHSHFETADDEIILETCDIQSRTLTAKPARKLDTTDEVVVTAWRLDCRELASPTWGCQKKLDGSHA